MTTVKTIEIGGHKVSVQLDDNLLTDRGHYGEWCYRDLSIILNKNSGTTVRHQTLLHEIIEAVNDLNELDLKHPTIQTLAASLYQVLAKNPDIFKDV